MVGRFAGILVVPTIRGLDGVMMSPSAEAPFGATCQVVADDVLSGCSAHVIGRTAP
jgi:hypothetical protein